MKKNWLTNSIIYVCIFYMIFSPLFPIIEIVSAETKQDKIEICHKSESEEQHTIEINTNAVDSHLNHGDTIGKCPDNSEDINNDNTSSTQIQQPQTNYYFVGISSSTKDLFFGEIQNQELKLNLKTKIDKVQLPKSLAVSRTGWIYVVDDANNNLYKFAVNSSPELVGNLNISGSIESLIFDSNDNLYLVGNDNKKLYKVDKATANIYEIAHIPFSNIQGLTFRHGSDSYLYGINHTGNDHKLIGIDITTGKSSNISNLRASNKTFTNIGSIGSDEYGFLYVAAETTEGTVVAKLTSQGEIVNVYNVSNYKNIDGLDIVPNTLFDTHPPTGIIYFWDINGREITSTNSTYGAKVVYRATDLRPDGKESTGIAYVRFTKERNTAYGDGNNWESSSYFPYTEDCGIWSGPCNSWDGGTIAVPIKYLSEGRQTWYMQVADKAGNVTTVDGSLIIDRTPPVIDKILIGHEQYDISNPVYTTSTRNFVSYISYDSLKTIHGIQLNSDNVSGLAKVRFSKDGVNFGKWQTQRDNGFGSFEETWGLYSDGTVFKIYMEAADKAGNFTIGKYDVIKYSQANLSVYLSINNGYEYTDSDLITLTVQASSIINGENLQVSNIRFMSCDIACDTSSGNWTGWQDYSESNINYVLSNGNELGKKMICIQVKDEAGTISNARCDTIILDSSKGNLYNLTVEGNNGIVSATYPIPVLQGPNYSFDTITTLPFGSKVEIISKYTEGNSCWYQIRLINDEVGWAECKYFETSDELSVEIVEPLLPYSEPRYPCGDINLYYSPSLDSRIIGYLSELDKVYLISEQENWYRIILKSGIQGYIQKENICDQPNTESQFIIPFEGEALVTSEFGTRDGEIHAGLDFGLACGTELYAIKAGKVLFAKTDGLVLGNSSDSSTPSNYVAIDHGEGWISYYYHMDQVWVVEGQILYQGESIGTSGNTGYVRDDASLVHTEQGCHLDLEIRYNGVAQDPAKLLGIETDNLGLIEDGFYGAYGAGTIASFDDPYDVNSASSIFAKYIRDDLTSWTEIERWGEYINVGEYDLESGVENEGYWQLVNDLKYSVHKYDSNCSIWVQDLGDIEYSNHKIFEDEVMGEDGILILNPHLGKVYAVISESDDYGDLWHKYIATGGPCGSLGLPTSEIGAAGVYPSHPEGSYDNQEATYQQFVRYTNIHGGGSDSYGALYWYGWAGWLGRDDSKYINCSECDEEYAVYGNAEKLYSDVGGSWSRYGFPISDPYNECGGINNSQDFEFGKLSACTPPPRPVCDYIPGISDVCETDTFAKYIKNLIEAGIVNGFSDGTYRADESVTRAEMAKFVKNAFGIPTDTSCGNFPDVSPTHHFYEYITSLKCAEIIHGDNGVYYPNDPVSRGATTKYVINAIEYKFGIDLKEAGISDEHNFPDVVGNTFEPYIGLLTNMWVDNERIISGNNGLYFPDEPTTRGAMAKIVDLARRWGDIPYVPSDNDPSTLDDIVDELVDQQDNYALDNLTIHWSPGDELTQEDVGQAEYEVIKEIIKDDAGNAYVMSIPLVDTGKSREYLGKLTIFNPTDRALSEIRSLRLAHMSYGIYDDLFLYNGEYHSYIYFEDCLSTLDAVGNLDSGCSEFVDIDWTRTAGLAPYITYDELFRDYYLVGSLKRLNNENVLSDDDIFPTKGTYIKFESVYDESFIDYYNSSNVHIFKVGDHYNDIPDYSYWWDQEELFTNTIPQTICFLGGMMYSAGVGSVICIGFTGAEVVSKGYADSSDIADVSLELAFYGGGKLLSAIYRKFKPTLKPILEESTEVGFKRVLIEIAGETIKRGTDDVAKSVDNLAKGTERGIASEKSERTARIILEKSDVIRPNPDDISSSLWKEIMGAHYGIPGNVPLTPKTGEFKGVIYDGLKDGVYYEMKDYTGKIGLTYQTRLEIYLAVKEQNPLIFITNTGTLDDFTKPMADLIKKYPNIKVEKFISK